MSEAEEESKSEMDSSSEGFNTDDQNEPKTDRQEESSEDEEQDNINHKLAELGQQEKNMVRQLSKVAKGSIEKGRHVRNQQVCVCLFNLRAYTIIFWIPESDYKSYSTYQIDSRLLKRSLFSQKRMRRFDRMHRPSSVDCYASCITYESTYSLKIFTPRHHLSQPSVKRLIKPMFPKFGMISTI
jgi:hypothetical protein